MFRDKMKLLTTVLLAVSLLVGELALSATGVAFAATAKPVASVPPATARWVRCVVDGDWDGDDWCWVGGARYFMGNGLYGFANGRYFMGRNFMGNRYMLPNGNRYILPNGLVVRNGYIMRNGMIVGYMNLLGNPIYYMP